MKVFFDASVIISALLSPSGGSSLLIRLNQTGKIIGFTSETVIEEIIDEEKFEKLQKSQEEIKDFISKSKLIVIESIGLNEWKIYENKVDEEDAHLISGSIQTNCQYLVTLDKKHLLRQDIKNKFLPLKIVNPKELLEEIF